MQLDGLSQMLLEKQIYLKATEDAIETLSGKGIRPEVWGASCETCGSKRGVKCLV